MANLAGDILAEALLVIEDVTVKQDQDIELGEVIYNDGNGFLVAPNTLTGIVKLYVALEAHVYATATAAGKSHVITAALMGKICVQKISGTAIKEGDKVSIGATPGEVEVFVAGVMPTGGVSTYYTSAIEAALQLAIDKNEGITLGTCAADAADTDTLVDVWVGVK